jgi:hypothetical protein
MEFEMSREELLNPLGLVRREVIGKERNLLAARLIGDHLGEKGDKLLAGVARRFCPPPRHCGCSARLCSERCRSGSTKAVELHSPLGDEQDRIEPIQSLDGGLFVDAEDRRMVGRLHIQPNNISRLELE